MTDITENVVKLAFDKEGTTRGDVAGWLRTLADEVERAELGKVSSATMLFVVDHPDEGKNSFSVKMRRCNMHYLTVLGAFRTMMHDMLHASFD